MSTNPTPPAAIPSIQIQGDVNSSTIVFGDNNFAVNTNHGTIVYKASRPKVSRLGFNPAAPRPPLHFLDRISEAQQAARILASHQPLVLHGVEGAGKTTLLKQVANLLPAEQFPDGVVHVDGEWDALSASGLDGVVQSVFEALFESDPPLKVSLSTARTFLGSVKPLILLDHLALPREAWRKLPDLFPAGGLLWSMAHSPPAQAAHELPLAGLPPAESRQLFLQASGMLEAAADPLLVQQICEKLDYLPLAIVTTGNWLRTGRISLAEALERITAQASPGKSANERALAAIAASLSQPEEDIFSLLAAAGGPVLDRAVLVQASGIEASAAQATVEALEAAGLFQVDGVDVSLHPVHKAFARKLRPANDQQQARLAGAILRYAIAHQAVPGTLRAQVGNLLGVLDYSLQAGNIEQAAVAARLAVPRLVLSGKWDLWRETCQRMLDAARLGGDQLQAGRALHELGTHQLATGNSAEAAQLLTQARDLRLQNGDAVGAAYSQHNLNHLRVPPAGGQPTGSQGNSPSSSRPSWLWMVGIALLSVFALGALFLFRPGRSTPPPSPAAPVVSVTEPGPGAVLPVTGSTDTSTPTGTFTLTPTGTISPSLTPTFTPTPTATYTPTPSATFTSSPTATLPPTPTFTATNTPYPTPFGVIVFTSDREGTNNAANAIYFKRVRADGSGTAEPLMDLQGNDSRPDLPRRGDRIALTHVEEGELAIYYTNGGNLLRVPRPTDAELSHPDWSPDGSRIAYQSDEDDDMEIYVLDLRSSSQPVQLTHNNRRDFCPDWSPDSRQIAFSRDRGGNNEDIFVMDADGSDQENLTENSPGVDRCPIWSPDGELIAYQSDRGGSAQIWIMNADGTNQRPLTALAPIDVAPVLGPAAWSPDGSWLAFMTQETGNWNIYLISLDGNSYLEIIRGGRDDVYPVWVEELNIDPSDLRFAGTD